MSPSPSLCSTAGLHADDPILIDISKFFVERGTVDKLAVVLLREIPPYGPDFVKKHKTADTQWEEVALEVLREWWVVHIRQWVKHNIDCQPDPIMFIIVREGVGIFCHSSPPPPPRSGLLGVKFYAHVNFWSCYTCGFWLMLCRPGFYAQWTLFKCWSNGALTMYFRASLSQVC